MKRKQTRRAARPAAGNGHDREAVVAYTLEEALLWIEDRAAMLRFLHECAVEEPDTFDAAAASGIADACGDIQHAARAVRRSLAVDVGSVGVKWAPRLGEGGAR